MGTIKKAAIMMIIGFIIPFLFGSKAGAGYIKYAAVMGFTLGFPNILSAVVIMSGVLLLWILWLINSKKGGHKTKHAMEPFISVGFVISFISSSTINIR